MEKNLTLIPHIDVNDTEGKNLKSYNNELMHNFSNSQDTFIGFGGNVVREKVKSQAPWFVTDFKELLQELQPSQNGVISKETELCNGVNGNETERLLNAVNGKEKHLNGTIY